MFVTWSNSSFHLFQNLITFVYTSKYIYMLWLSNRIHIIYQINMNSPPQPFYSYISFFLPPISCILYMYMYNYINELIPKEFPNIYRSSLNFFTLSLLAWSSASRFFLSSSISFSTRVWNFSQL